MTGSAIVSIQAARTSNGVSKNAKVWPEILVIADMHLGPTGDHVGLSFPVEAMSRVDIPGIELTTFLAILAPGAAVRYVGNVKRLQEC